MAGNSNEPGRSVVSKLFAVMHELARADTSLSAGAIARSSGIPTSTVLRLLREMCEQGFARRNADGQYEIGLSIWRIGIRAREFDSIRAVAVPYMHELYGATRNSVNLAVLDGHGGAVTLEKLSGLRSPKVTGETGSNMPLHATAAGKALLAFAPRELFEQLCRHPLPRYTEHTITSPTRLAGEVRTIRGNGVAIARHEVEEHAVAVAAPVFLDGVVEASLSVAGVDTTMDVDRVAPLVQRIAREISRKLVRPPAKNRL